MKQKTKFYCLKCYTSSEGSKCTNEACGKPEPKLVRPDQLFKLGDFVHISLTDKTSEFHNETGRVCGFQGDNVMVDLGSKREFPLSRALAFDANELTKIYFNVKELEDDIRWATPLYFCSVCRFSSANPDRCTNTLCELNQTEEGPNCSDNPNCDGGCCKRDAELPMSPYTKNIMAGGCVQTVDAPDLGVPAYAQLPAPPAPEPKGEPVQIKILAERVGDKLIIHEATTVESDYCYERQQEDGLVDAHILTLTLDADKIVSVIPETRKIEVDLR